MIDHSLSEVQYFKYLKGGVMIKKLWLAAVWAACFLGGMVVTKFAIEGYRATKGVNSAQAELMKMKTDAVSARPDLAPSKAFIEAASKNAESTLASADTADKKLSVAAEQFFGFYFINVKTRYEYCDKLGVDISPFVNAFKAIHAQEYRIASDAVAREKYNPEWVLSKMAPSMRSIIDQTMNDAAQQYKVTPKDICTGLAEHGPESAAGLALQKLAPKIYGALHVR